MRRIALAILGSALTAIYWWIVFMIVYADVLFAGDRNPALPPAPDRDIVTKAILAIVVGVIVYACLMVIWQRLTAKRADS